DPRDLHGYHHAITIMPHARANGGLAQLSRLRRAIPLPNKAEAVYERRYRWLEKGMASLPDGPRSGAPSKLSPEQLEQLKVWASEEALTAPALLARLEEQFGVRVHRNTLTGALRRAGLVWKRTRHSLKKTQRTAVPTSPG
ncbi:helix-turn-helix domain-containing protein, partial [Burkholderia sp. DN3021]|uniref:helix-turn-helix domain-containing protein n=1 Tax=Burkholderia sp. DN3021 TaxID=3410137 RepID=UPI003C7D8AAF